MGAKERVHALPVWRGLKSIVPLKGGVSNASFTVEDSTGKYVARVGEDYSCHQVSRQREGIAARETEGDAADDFLALVPASGSATGPDQKLVRGLRLLGHDRRHELDEALTGTFDVPR